MSGDNQPLPGGEQVKPKPVTLEEVVVAKGRTVTHEGRDRGPGSKISVSVEEAKHLRRAGFLFVAEDEAAPEEGVSVNGETKAVVRPK